MKKSKVCRGCEDRTSTCHATCERYKEECAELAAQKEAISEAMNVTRKHSGRNSCTYKDVAKENPELLKAVIDTLNRKAWNEQ